MAAPRVIASRLILSLVLATTMIESMASDVDNRAEARLNLADGSSSRAEYVFFKTPFGPIPVRLFWDTAPKTVALVMELAQSEDQALNAFYRNEARPTVSLASPPAAQICYAYGLKSMRYGSASLEAPGRRLLCCSSCPFLPRSTASAASTNHAPPAFSHRARKGAALPMHCCRGASTSDMRRQRRESW
jgi:hypothetical protein